MRIPLVEIFKKFGEISLFPWHCILCMQYSNRSIALCKECEDFLPWLKESNQLHTLKNIHHHIDDFQALFEYSHPIDKFMAKYKYGSHLYFANLMGHLMAEKMVLKYPIDSLLYMPLHPLRQRTRGFNQTLELAKVIAKVRNFSFNRGEITKIKHTSPQSTLSKQKRLQNIKESTFSLSQSFNALHVLIIEDIVTTGTTIASLSALLKTHGVETIQVWACCRAL